MLKGFNNISVWFLILGLALLLGLPTRTVAYPAPSDLVSDLVLDTTITLTNPTTGKQTLNFVQLGVVLEYKASQISPCPNGIIEGRLAAGENSGVTLEIAGDSAALYLVLSACGSNPIIIPNIVGQIYKITSSTKTYTLTVQDAGNDAVQFLFDDPSVGVEPLTKTSPFHHTPSQKLYNLKGSLQSQKGLPGVKNVNRKVLFSKP